MTAITTFDNTAEGWERSLYAFLAKTERRWGSRRTAVGDSRMLSHFFGTVGTPPDRLRLGGTAAASQASSHRPSHRRTGSPA